MKHQITSGTVDNKKKVLIVQSSSNLDGSAVSGLLLADGFREAGWITHVAFAFEGPVIKEYADAGHQVHIVPHKNWLRRESSLQFAKDVVAEWSGVSTFVNLLERVKPNAVYLNTLVSFAAALAANRTRIPCVWHLREMFANIGGEMRAPKWARPVLPRVIRYCATEIVANSVATAENIMGASTRYRVHIVPNAVGTRFFEETRSPEEARKDLGITQEGTIIGVPGTLRPVKGHLFFMRSIASILRERSECHVIVTGRANSEYAAQVSALIADLQLTRQVHLLGSVQDMPAFYRSSDFVVVPSVAEPFGRTIVEAMAVGTPVLATSVGGIPEIIDHGRTGWLVPYGNEDAVREGVMKLLTGRFLREDIQKESRCVAQDRYHERAYKERLVATTQAVVDRLCKPSA